MNFKKYTCVILIISIIILIFPEIKTKAGGASDFLLNKDMTELNVYPGGITGTYVPDEKQNYRIIIDGKVKKFNMADVTVGNKLMLPLDELLNSFGIDKKNILWNQKDKSYRIINGKNKIEFKIGEKVAYINKKAVKLADAAVMYKDKPYIPINYVSLFDRIVYLDKDTNSYLISKQTTFNSVKQIIERIDKSTASIKKFKAVISNYACSRLDDNEEITNEKTTLQKDISGNRYYYTTAAADGSFEQYYSDGVVYNRQSNEKQWVKYGEGVESITDFYGLSELYEKSNIFYAGLTVTEDKKKNEIKLTGSSYLNTYIFYAVEGGINEVALTDYSYEIIINKSNYTLKNIKFKLNGKNRTNDFPFDFKQQYEISITDINGSFKIIPPKGIENAELLQG